MKKGEKTGACAVVITGHHRYVLRILKRLELILLRSLVTTLRVAEKYDEAHLSSPEVAPIVDGAKVFYFEGYFLTHGTDILTSLAQKVSAAGKVHNIHCRPIRILTFFRSP